MDTSLLKENLKIEVSSSREFISMVSKGNPSHLNPNIALFHESVTRVASQAKDGMTCHF
jgi:hypothetical protein